MWVWILRGSPTPKETSLAVCYFPSTTSSFVVHLDGRPLPGTISEQSEVLLYGDCNTFGRLQCLEQDNADTH